MKSRKSPKNFLSRVTFSISLRGREYISGEEEKERETDFFPQIHARASDFVKTLIDLRGRLEWLVICTALVF